MKPSIIAKTPRSSKRKKLWPWIVLFLIIFCAIYSYERVSDYLTVNADQLPFMLLDLVLEYFLGEPTPPGVTNV